LVIDFVIFFGILVKRAILTNKGEFKMNKAIATALLISIALVSMFFTYAYASDSTAELKPYINSVDSAKEGMSLWQVIKSGGFIMFVLTLLSIAATTIITYNFISLKTDNLAPKDFAEGIIEDLEEKKDKAVLSMCNAEDNIISSIVIAGLKKKDKGSIFAREAMENCVRQELGKLWQNISYLSDIATIAPLIGLLGTVLGMMQAFNVIAFQTAVVKPILLAGGVSKAMVTTAGGLIVAIPVMLFYTYFRSKVQEISSLIEGYATDIIKIIEEV